MTDFKAKIHQIRFRLGLRPRPRWRSLERSPDPLAGFGRTALRQGGGGAGLGWGRAGKGRGEGKGGGIGGEGKGGPQVTVEPGPLRALLRHCPHTTLAADWPTALNRDKRTDDGRQQSRSWRTTTKATVDAARHRIYTTRLLPGRRNPSFAWQQRCAAILFRSATSIVPHSRRCGCNCRCVGPGLMTYVGARLPLTGIRGEDSIDVRARRRLAIKSPNLNRTE